MLVSRSAAPLLRGHFDLEPVPVATSDAGSAFHLIGHHWPDREAKQHPPTPFVGRQHELELLERLFARAEAGRGQVASPPRVPPAVGGPAVRLPCGEMLALRPWNGCLDRRRGNETGLGYHRWRR